MPDLFTVHNAAKVRVWAPPATIEGLAAPAGTLRGRIAPNEVVFVGAPGTAGALVETLEGQLAPQGSKALVVDHTDGWTVFSITGPGSAEVFRRISMVPLPAAADEPVFFMGRIGDVAAKAFRRGDRIDFMTGTETWRHVLEVLEHAGHSVGLRSVPTPDSDPMGVAR